MSTENRIVQNQYSVGVGIVYTFNLVFGTGALLLPYAFSRVGYALGLVFYAVLIFFSYMTCSFILESIALANALENHEQLNGNNVGGDDSNGNAKTSDSNEPLLNEAATSGITNGDNNKNNDEKALLEDIDVPSVKDLFYKDRKLELSELASRLGNKWVYYFTQLSMIGYLFGDLLIYLSMVGTSMQNLSCAKIDNKETPVSRMCDKIGYFNFYRIAIAAFTLLVGPMLYTNMTKTKAVQYGTIVLRWTAFLIMFVLLVMRIHENRESPLKPKAADFSELPTFLGSGLYAFMCHHSIPGMVFPIKVRNRNLNVVFIVSLILALALYVTVSMTSVFAIRYEDFLTVLTLNFINFRSGRFFVFLTVFLQLFPVIALSSSYPIVGITLRENIKSLFYSKDAIANSSWKDSRRNFVIQKVLIPSVLVFLPFVILAAAESQISTLTGNVGTYLGSMVQYVIPGLLMLFGRPKVRNAIGDAAMRQNPNRSPFRTWLVYALFIWTIFALGMVTYLKVKNSLSNV